MKNKIDISQESYQELRSIAIKEGYDNLDALFMDMVIEYKKRKLITASELLREAMEKIGISIDDLLLT